jgi:hypothetical protein
VVFSKVFSCTWLASWCQSMSVSNSAFVTETWKCCLQLFPFVYEFSVIYVVFQFCIKHCNVVCIVTFFRSISEKNWYLVLHYFCKEFGSFLVDLVTVHFGPSEEDGSSVWEWKVYSGRHPMSKRTWDIGVVQVITREINQAIVLAVEKKCR